MSRRILPVAPLRQRGFSFFEVLVAALVLGIGVLGFAGLQVRALNSSGDAHFRAQAAVLAAELAERIRMADAGLTLDHTAYEIATLWDPSATPVPTTPPTSWTLGTNRCIATSVAGASCNEAALVRSDALEIRYMADRLLPNGNVSVRACEAGSTLTCVFVAWRDVDSADCDINAPQENCVSAQVLF